MIVELRKKFPELPELAPHKPYFIIGIEADDYRLLNDNGKPFLYSAEIFKIIDDEEPQDWVSEYGDDGERYAYPPVLNSIGFFEDFFDNKQEAVHLFWQTVNQRLMLAA
jgi:hypothetical protein